MAKKSNLNEQKIDFVITQAFEKYADYVANEQASDDLEQLLSPEEFAIMEEQRKKVFAKVSKKINNDSFSNYRKRVKVCAILVAVCICIFAVMTNATAFRTFMYKTYVDTKGTVLKLNTNKNIEEDYAFITSFCEMDEVIIPGWLPAGTAIKQAEEAESQLKIKFEGEDLQLALSEISINEGDVNTNVETEDNTYKIENSQVLGMKCQIILITSELDDEMYIVTWNSDKVRYTLSANCSRIMLDSILSELRYL